MSHSTYAVPNGKSVFHTDDREDALDIVSVSRNDPNAFPNPQRFTSRASQSALQNVANHNPYLGVDQKTILDGLWRW